MERNGRQVVGIDVGSVAVGVAVVSMAKKVVATAYRFHHGDILGTVRQLVAELPLTGPCHYVATASTPDEIQAEQRYHNEIACITAAKHYHPQLRGLLLVGGERFSLASFDSDGHYLGSTTNTSCAAGTGSFLDQQAGRLNLRGIKELSAVACSSTGALPQVATRCAVFAKTDLIHAQQEGYQLDQIADGLCHGLAKNLVDTLFSAAASPVGPVVFCGGVARNLAVVRHIEALTGLRLIVAEHGHLYGAIGASLARVDELSEGHRQGLVVPLPGRRDLIRHEPDGRVRPYAYPPLSLHLSSYPEFNGLEHYVTSDEGKAAVEVDLYHQLTAGQELSISLGIDIGSTSTKAVLIDEKGEVLVGLYTRTAGRPLVAVQAIFQAIAAIETAKTVHFAVCQCGTTGSGRKFIGTIIGADGIIDEITAHARAACQLHPEVDTIIEIGGQDAKFTTLKDGWVTSSTMNTVCAAGTGSFIEEQAAKLGVAVADYSRLAENARAPMVSDRCTVFMERDINHYLSEGYGVDEVLAAALHAVRENYLRKVATEKDIGQTILFQGATAKNKALVAAFEQRLGKPLLVSKFCHLTGALGAALIQQDEQRAASSFVGIDFHRQQVESTSEICQICANHCKLSVATIDGRKVAYGFLCGRDYDQEVYVTRPSTAFDLLAERRKIKKFTPQAAANGPLIGLPAAVHLLDDLALWRKFFDLLGCRTISSEGYKDGLRVGKKLSRAEFCAPLTAMHGHCDWLLRRSDYVFMPVYLETKAKEGRRQSCYYTQFLPSLLATAAGGQAERILRPIVKYLYTSFHTSMELYRMMQRIQSGRWNFVEVSIAYSKACEFDQDCRRRQRQLLTDQGEGKGDISVVFLGRPYTLLSPTINGNIPGIFQSLGVNGYYQDMLSYQADEVAALQPLLGEIHWEQSARILEAAEVLARRPGLYPVFVTSFQCAPDSFTLEYFKAIMAEHGKPYLILQLDGHDSSVGYETRIEAAIRAFRNHLAKQATTGQVAIDYTDINPRLDPALCRKHVILPNWDELTCSLLAASLRREGMDARLMTETDGTIRQSLRYNSGQCLPLTAIAEGYRDTIRQHRLNPADCVLWLNRSTLACNIKLYPHQIKRILIAEGMAEAGVYVGEMSFTEISPRAAMNAYFSYMFGGMLRKVACRIRPYEVEKGETDRVLAKGLKILIDAFVGLRAKEEALAEVISRFTWIETAGARRPQVAIFGDLYSRDNAVMNQGLVHFIEAQGGEVITTPYSEYAKMIAASYFRKWFNEGSYLNVLAYRALLATMSTMEKRYMRLFNRILGEGEHEYSDDPAAILAQYGIAPENTGESMDNMIKIHYIKKHYPDVSLFVQASPSLCCASLITEAMKEEIEHRTGVPVVSITYDGTGGNKNEAIVPYLRYPRSITGVVGGHVAGGVYDGVRLA